MILKQSVVNTIGELGEIELFIPDEIWEDEWGCLEYIEKEMAKRDYHPCDICGLYADKDPKDICESCKAEMREWYKTTRPKGI